MVSQVGPNELEADTCGEIVTDICAIRRRQGQIVTGERTEHFTPLTGPRLFTEIQQGTVDTDVPPPLDGL